MDTLGEGMTDTEIRDKVAEHDAVIAQMHERINAIERRLLTVEARLSGVGNHFLYGAAALAALMTLYEWL
jgi:hypothetical protein